ncbi:MAG: MBL fold metallo-hydrolase [Pseudomonadales bacterium]
MSTFPRMTLLALLTIASFSFAQEAEKPVLTHSEIRDGVHLIQGDGGNVVVIEGDRSMLVIDNGYPEQAADLFNTIMQVGNKPLRFMVNTHWHFDHAGGNDYLGPRTNLVAHDNVRKRLSEGMTFEAFNRVVPPAEPHALPVVTYSDSTNLFEGKQVIRLKHFANGHTDGDSVAFIEPSKIVHTGDHYFANWFPFVDLQSGGSVAGMTRNVAAILAMIDDDWIVVPGHGPLSKKADLQRTHEMLTQSVAWMTERLAEGLSLEQMTELGLPENLKPWGIGFIKEPNWIATLYTSLKDAE